MFVGESVVMMTVRALNKGDKAVVCFQGAKVEAITERVEQIMGPGKGGSISGTNNAEREGTTATRDTGS